MVAIAIPIAVAVTVSVRMAVAAVGRRRMELFEPRARILRRRVKPRQPQAHFGGRARLTGIAAAEDDVLHPIAAEALCALLAEHPGDGVGHVAFAASVRPDDGRDAMVEGELRPVGERFKTVDFETF
jgi:hypothetical protein